MEKDKENVRVRQLLRYPKEYLVEICRQRGLSIHGTKFQLACRLAKFAEDQAIKDWRAISG